MMLLLNIKNFHLSIKNPRFYKEKVKKMKKNINQDLLHLKGMKYLIMICK